MYKYCLQILIILILANSCITHKQHYKESNNKISKYNPTDPVCGENVVWHIHLQDGFNNDTIQFVLGKDTLPSKKDSIPDLIAKTRENGCTNIYFTCYSKDNKY